MKLKILKYLPSSFPWQDRIHCHTSLDSTNLLAKTMASQGAPNGTIILAQHQTAGRGRMERSFHSPQGKGVYLSVILRPDCKAKQLMHLTCSAGVAMCDAVEQVTGIRPGIKWINDLVYAGRKIGGILTEMSVNADGRIDFAIIGIGINCTQKAVDFPEELQQIAASLSQVTGATVSPSKLAAAMILALERLSHTLIHGKEQFLTQYRKDCITLGKEILIHTGDQVQIATACDVGADGELIVRYPDGKVNCVQSGEVSIRGLCGYT